jgi:indolepyruvate ferredoxin oxidoreductase beta subunit
MSSTTGTRIVVAGLGGQGVLFATRLMAEAALSTGQPALTSETHGMAQRGGSVVASLKIGSFRSALVLDGSADLLLSLDQGEARRNLAVLAPGARCLCSSAQPWDPTVRAAAGSADIGLYAVDAAGIALRLGAPVLANIALLGALSVFPFAPVSPDALEQVLRRRSPPRVLKGNLAALAAGRSAGAAVLG